MERRNMKVESVRRTIRILQLLSCGAIIGLYAVKAFGLAGVDYPLRAETFGAGAGAASVLILKILHVL